MAIFASACALLSQVTLAAVSATTRCYDGSGGFAKAQWPHCQQVHDNILMYYGVSSDGDYLKLGLYAAEHSGWSALALAGNSGMKGAQYLVVRKEGGTWVAEERYATGYTTPQLQQTQDVTLIFAEEEGANTAWGLLVPMTSCKIGERYPIEDVSRWMLWGLGSSHTFAYHGTGTRRGQFHANLISGPKTSPDFSGMKQVDLLMPDIDVALGAGGTDPTNPYICGIFDLAQLLPSGLNIDDKHHVIKFAPKLNATTEKYAHHMILYSCDVGLEMGLTFTHGQVITDCESMPRGCYAMKYAWAVGSEDIIFPADVGMPVGGQIRWLALQFHYYNPGLVTGLKDNSGVQMTLADSPRANDAAILAVNGGTGPWQRSNLPPGHANIVLPTMVIPKEATNTWEVPSINLLGVVYHGHLIGKSFNMDVTNGGNYLGVIRREKRYDFNHQSIEEPSLKTLKRGDEVTFTCAYDTSSRISETSFGDATQNEMCWGAILYYPALSQMTTCSFEGADGTKRRTHCRGMRDDVEFDAPAVNPPTCSQRGDLSSSTATSILDGVRAVHGSPATRPTTTPPGVTYDDMGAVTSAARYTVISWLLLAVLAIRTIAAFGV